MATWTAKLTRHEIRSRLPASSVLGEQMQDMINNIAVVSDFANKQDNGNAQASSNKNWQLA